MVIDFLSSMLQGYISLSSKLWGYGFFVLYSKDLNNWRVYYQVQNSLLSEGRKNVAIRRHLSPL